MIKFNPKELKAFRLSDFSGGVNTDQGNSTKELLQCKNLILDSKGRPFTRGGSRVLNPKAAIGKEDLYVYGYLLAFEGALPVYDTNFVTAGTLSASSAGASNPASNANDDDDETYWEMEADKALAGTMTASSGASPTNMNDGNDATYWEAVI